MSASETRPAAFRPRIGGRRGHIAPQRVPTFRAGLLARLQQRFGHAYRATSIALGADARRPRPSTEVGVPGPRARRCIVKARIVVMNQRGMAAARLHLQYITREGVETDGSKGVVFGRGEGDASAELREAIPAEQRQFRFIVSPEDRDVDLRWFTRALMRQVEADLGREVVWGAVRHHDTDNPHVHVVVRGVDRKGRELRIDREYISRRMRWRAQELLTRELGPRSLVEIRRQRDREVEQERFTTLDRDLERRGGDRIDMAALRSASSEQRARLVGRLQVLEDLELVRRSGFAEWTFVPGWQGALRELGQRGDIIKRINAALPTDGVRGPEQIIDGRSDLPPVEGVLRRKGLHDELRGDVYAIVEDHRGAAHYVRVDPRTAEGAAEGAIVRVSVAPVSWGRRIDEAIVASAAKTGGIYDPVAHRADLQARPPAAGDRAVSPEEAVAASVRRLEHLGRHKLVEPLPDGRWRVPANLVEQLRERDQTEPRRRVRLEEIAPTLAVQAARRGRAWVDRVEPLAPFGFGAEIREAQARRAALAPAIAAPAPAVRPFIPRDAEGRAACEGFAREHRLTFVPEAPAGFRGVAVACPGRDGRQHLALMHAASGRLAMVPGGALPATAAGRVWEVVRRGDGTPMVRPYGLSRDR